MKDDELVLIVVHPQTLEQLKAEGQTDGMEDAVLTTTLVPIGQAVTIRKADFVRLITN